MHDTSSSTLQRRVVCLPVRPQLASSGWLFVGAGAVATALLLAFCITALSQRDVMVRLLHTLIAASLLPFAALVVIYGLWMLLGSDEVEISGSSLVARRRVRGFCWSRRCDIAKVRRLCLASFCYQAAPATHTLYAELNGATPLTLATDYPEVTLQELAQSIVRHACHVSIVATEIDAIKAATRNRPYSRVALAAGLMVVLGPFLTATGVPAWIMDQTSLKWPSVPGQIVHSELVVTKRPKGGQQVTDYRADIKYDYVVQQTSFRGDRLHFGVEALESGQRTRVDAELRNYPIGKNVLVYYNPRAPAIAVLEPGRGSPAAALCTLLGLGLFVCGFPAVTFCVLRMASPGNHVLYQADLEYDPRHPGGIATLIASYLRSDLIIILILILPLGMVLFFVTIALLFFVM